MDRSDELLLDALRCAIRGEPVCWDIQPAAEDLYRAISLARRHSVLPLFVHACSEVFGILPDRELERLRQEARAITISQAAHTADLLLLMDELSTRGLRPAIMKGLICRELYPEPEQRASVDEDLLIAPDDLSAYHEALLDLGAQPVHPETALPGADEVSYTIEARGLYIELHMCLFPADSDAYGDCAALFNGAVGRSVIQHIYGRELRTLSPTDHMLFLLCHAYKHLLHGGVGIRQICDICLFAERYGCKISWENVLASCKKIHIDVLSAAMFRIGAQHLGLPAPDVFSTIETDELPLLDDCLTGGLYGADDIDRLHSSTLTLEAVAAGKTGRRRRGALHSLFLPASSLAGRFPYLQRRPWLLPVAWVQRAWGYAMERGKVDPGRSMQIGAQRIDMLQKYQVLP